MATFTFFSPELIKAQQHFNTLATAKSLLTPGEKYDLETSTKDSIFKIVSGRYINIYYTASCAVTECGTIDTTSSFWTSAISQATPKRREKLEELANTINAKIKRLVERKTA